MSKYNILSGVKARQCIHVVLLLVFIASTFTSLFLMPASNTEALSGSQFNPGRIIDDAVFYNKDTMSAPQIQAFLNSKVPRCDTNHKKSSNKNDSGPPYTCLKDYRQNTTNIAPESGLCNGYTGASNETAATIIYKVAQSCGINPQVLIVMLQKEQSLITDTWPWNIQYEKAMGAFCPDTAPCDPKYKGFFYQVYYGAHRFKVYRANPNSFNYKAGRNNSILWHPNTSCGRSNVYIQNQATAGLYIYTPYRPNKAALDNLYGTGNSCSSYGNRNFWRMFNDWFGPTTGSPLFRFGNSDGVYILGANNNYYHIPSRRVLEAYGYGSTVSSVESVSKNYVSGRKFSGNLPLIARFEGNEVYMLSKGRSHHFPSRQLLQTYGYDIGQEALLRRQDKEYFPDSQVMQPTLRNADGPEVWSVESGKKRHIINGEAYRSGSPSYASRPTVSLSQSVAASIPNGGPIMTNNKLLRRSNNDSYCFWDGKRCQDVHKRTVSELKLNTDYSAHSSIINQMPAGGATIDKFVRDTDNNLYLLDSKQRFRISTAQLPDMGLTSSSFAEAPDGLLSRVPKIVQFELIFRINRQDAVFLIDSGKRRHFLDRQSVSEKGYVLSQTISLNASSANLFPVGSKLFSVGTLFRINNSDKIQLINSPTSSVHVASRNVMSDFGFSFNKVRLQTKSQVAGYPETGKLGHFSKDPSGNVWVTVGGKQKRLVSLTMRETPNYNLDVSALPTLNSSVLNRFGTAANITNLVQATGDPRVYKIENGKKRWVTTRAALTANGLSFSNITPVSQTFIASLPQGTNIYR